MAIYCIDDGGDGSQTNTTQSASTLDWSKADASVADLIAYDAAAFTTSGNIIYFGDDTSDPNKAAHWTLTGPTSGLPVILISADRTQTTPTYKVGTGNQLSSLGGTYQLTLDGGFAMYGLKAASGDLITLSVDRDESFLAKACTFLPAANRTVILSGASSTSKPRLELVGCLIDCAADGTTGRSASVVELLIGEVRITNMSFANVAYRTGQVFYPSTNADFSNITGLDISGFTNGTLCELFSFNSGGGGQPTTSNILTAATWAPFVSGNPGAGGRAIITNAGPADAPTYLCLKDGFGDIVSSSSIYRTGGATVEGEACSWLITTTANCAEGAPFYTPWIYGTVSSTGSKTFDLYITNDTADLTDAECWLEVEYLSTSDEAIWALATDQRATITTTAAAQTDDTTSTWTGTASFTYKQKLSVTATVGETGQYRARVAVGVASIASSRYFYCDPKIGIS